MAQKPPLLVSQVCNNMPLYAKRSSNRCLLLLPCPRVLCAVLTECICCAELLLLSGDVETNPGPTSKTRAGSSSLTDDSSTGDGSEILSILKAVQAQVTTIQISNNELKETVAQVHASQKSIEAGLAPIGTRLTVVEKKLQVLEEIEVDVQSTIDDLKKQNHFLQSRVDELEDRARRTNLIFHGLQMEKKLGIKQNKKSLACSHLVFRARYVALNVRIVLDSFHLQDAVQ